MNGGSRLPQLGSGRQVNHDRLRPQIHQYRKEKKGSFSADGRLNDETGDVTIRFKFTLTNC
jgi:hypothetical protein